ncbi:MAG: deoxyribonuclease IV [Planctomycetes bacterium]|nr:deoxyribonuclease IV [Planctomycetota bacterium]
MRVGSHRSAAGGVANAVREAVERGLDCVQLFTSNQRQWRPRQPSKEECAEWLEALKAAGWSDPEDHRVVSHNSYLVNLASPSAEARKRSIALQRSELERCEMLGIRLCVMHPGAHLGEKRSPKDKNDLSKEPTGEEMGGLKRLSASLDQIHKELPGYKVVTCLENTVGAGTTLGYNFNQLAAARSLVKEHQRIAYCIDTCHAVAAGYCMDTARAAGETLKRIDEHLTVERVMAFHANDSLFPCGSRKDRHAHILEGECGEACFKSLASVKAWRNVPVILETPKEGSFKGRDWDVENADRLRRLWGVKTAAAKGAVKKLAKSKAKTILALLLLAPLLMLNVGCKTKTLEQIRGETPIESAPAVSGPAAPNVREAAQLSQANQLMQSGDYDNALAAFQEILQENPKLPDAWVGVGQVQALKQDWTQSESAFANAADFDSSNFDAQFGRGKALQVLNKLVDAIRAYHRALLIRPEDFDANLNMATAYLQLDESKSAVVYAEKAVKLKPDSGVARINLGVAYEQSGKHEWAIQQYEMAAELMEPTPQLLTNLLNAYAKSKRYREAVNAALLLVKLAPTANSYERLGWAYFRVGDYEKSVRSYREAVRIDPKHWPAWNGVGVNLLNAWVVGGKKNTATQGDAKAAFERSLQQNPEQPKVLKLIKVYGL